MALREQLFQNLLTRGFDIFQKEVSISDLQKRHNAFNQRILMVRVMDIGVPPVYLQVRDGKVNRSFSYAGKPDAWIAFRTLDGLINFLDGSLTVDDIFAWDGQVLDPKTGKMVKEVKFDGDWVRGSAILKDILDGYLDTIRRVLNEEMRMAGYALKTYAKIKKGFKPAVANDWDDI